MTTGSSSENAYLTLLAEYQPRPIRSDPEASRVQAEIDALIDKPGELTKAETDILVLLGLLVDEWEGQRLGPPETSVLDRLNAVLRDNGVRQVDLVPDVFPTKSVASEVLRGRRPLTYEFVKRLIVRFHLSPAIFFDIPKKAIAEETTAYGAADD